MSTYYVADLHFGHNNVIKLSKRPFSNTEEMNSSLVESWNKRVKNGDRVYILGDLFYRFSAYEQILEKLNGEKHLILGNHDASWLEEYTVEKNDKNNQKSDTLPHKSYRLKDTKEDLSKYFKSVSEILQITDGQTGCIL